VTVGSEKGKGLGRGTGRCTLKLLAYTYDPFFPGSFDMYKHHLHYNFALIIVHHLAVLADKGII
jgi:hypothetical protein